ADGGDGELVGLVPVPAPVRQPYRSGGWRRRVRVHPPGLRGALKRVVVSTVERVQVAPEHMLAGRVGEPLGDPVESLHDEVVEAGAERGPSGHERGGMVTYRDFLYSPDEVGEPLAGRVLAVIPQRRVGSGSAGWEQPVSRQPYRCSDGEVLHPGHVWVPFGSGGGSLIVRGILGIPPVGKKTGSRPSYRRHEHAVSRALLHRFVAGRIWRGPAYVEPRSSSTPTS